MSRRRCAARRRGDLWAAVVVPALGLVLGLTACSDDDDPGNAVGPDEPATETTSDFIIEVTPPLEMQASADPDFIAGVLSDDVVTADELADAYERFIGCLTEGGGAGIYAYDIELHIDITADWSLADADSGGNEPASLYASCSRDFLGDLVSRYGTANRPGPDIGERQRENLIACVNAVNPEIAAALPDDITMDTSGDAPSFVELQLDPTTGLDVDEGQVLAVNRCVGSLGAGWIEFG